MTLDEFINHDWKKGDIIYVHDFASFAIEHITGVTKYTVTSVKRYFYDIDGEITPTHGYFYAENSKKTRIGFEWHFDDKGERPKTYELNRIYFTEEEAIKYKNKFNQESIEEERKRLENNLNGAEKQIKRHQDEYQQSLVDLIELKNEIRQFEEKYGKH